MLTLLDLQRHYVPNTPHLQLIGVKTWTHLLGGPITATLGLGCSFHGDSLLGKDVLVIRTLSILIPVSVISYCKMYTSDLENGFM